MQYGNRMTHRNIPHIYLGLNRTMQYGNDRVYLVFFFATDSLNRTMQYGNQKKSGRRSLFVSVFKSYYVVWKLAPATIPTKYGFLFKSYYVVWKHEIGKENPQLRYGLNRTMQYGNANASLKGNTLTEGLNRTMQYGNFFLIYLYF